MKELSVLSLTNPLRVPQVPAGKAKPSRARTHAAVLAALAISLAATAGCSSTGASASAGSAGSPSADQRAVATIVDRTLHDLGTNNYTDLCTIVAPGSAVLADGIDGCAMQSQASMMGAGQQSGAEAFLSKASQVTVDASKVVVNGDSATVPKSALLYQGQPVQQFEGMADENLVRKNGQWYLVVGS